MKEDVFDELIDQGVYLHPNNDASAWFIDLFGFALKEFPSREEAEEFRQLIKAKVRDEFDRIILNRRLSDALQKEHWESEITIAIERERQKMERR
jgi:hypothetical protein